jgi:hypothetical protein
MREVVTIRGRVQQIGGTPYTPARVPRQWRVVRERAAQADEG